MMCCRCLFNLTEQEAEEKGFVKIVLCQNEEGTTYEALLGRKGNKGIKLTEKQYNFSDYCQNNA